MKSVFVFTSLFLSAVAFGDQGSSCHFHGKKAAAEATVLECAAKRKESLIEKGKIEVSWKAVSHEKIEQIEMKNGKKEWKVTFKDPAAKDKTKETLFMFFALNGNFLASNFTGK